MASLAEIRAKLQAQETKSTSSSMATITPHTGIYPEGSSATLRFYQTQTRTILFGKKDK